MKNFLKLVLWAGITIGLIVFNADYLDFSWKFTLPTELAEDRIGPAPWPTKAELVDLGYPEREPGENYDPSTYDGALNTKLLNLKRLNFSLNYTADWQKEVDALADTYRFRFQLLAGLVTLVPGWLALIALRRWWVLSFSPLLQVLSFKFFGFKGGSLPAFVHDEMKQRQLKKQNEEYQQLESLLNNGLITHAQFETKRAAIAAKVQKNL